MTTRKALTGFVLLIAIATANIHALPVQDDPEAAEAARVRAREEAVIRAREQQAAREEQATRDWIKNQQDKSESNLTRREKEMAPFRGRENETKFRSLQNSAQELMELGVKINNQVEASGAQSISVTLYSDLDKMEKLIKTIRKSAK